MPATEIHLSKLAIHSETHTSFAGTNATFRLVACHTATDEYADEQFLADIEKAREPLETLAEKARVLLKAGKGRKFPE